VELEREKRKKGRNDRMGASIYAFKFRVFRRTFVFYSRREYSHLIIFATFCAVPFSFGLTTTCLYSILATLVRAILHAFTHARVLHLGRGGSSHCDSWNIHYSEELNAMNNYYVGRDTVVVAKEVTDVENEERDNNTKVRMYITQCRMEKFRLRSMTFCCGAS